MVYKLMGSDLFINHALTMMNQATESLVLDQQTLSLTNLLVPFLPLVKRFRR